MSSYKAKDQGNQLPPDLKPRLAASYNAIAEKYNAWTATHHESRLAALQTLLSKLKQDPSDPLAVLELGCGSGLPVIKNILGKFPNVQYIANELSSKQLELARQNLAGLEDHVAFVEGDMLDLDIPDGSQDAVIAMYSVIHLPREEQTLLMAKVYQWLKPGGFFLANFAAEDLEQVIMPHWLAEDGWMFWSGWGAEVTIEKLQEAGFEVLNSEIRSDVADASFLWVLVTKK